MYSNCVTLVSEPIKHWHCEGWKKGGKTAKAVMQKEYFQQRLYLAEASPSEGQQPGFICYLKIACSPLLVLRPLLGSLPTFQLMKCVGNQELHQALFQPGSTVTKQGEMKNKQCGQSVVRDWRPAVCSVAVKQTPPWRVKGISKSSLKLKIEALLINRADYILEWHESVKGCMWWQCPLCFLSFVIFVGHLFPPQ